MFRNFFKREKPRVYLGVMAVMPRSSLKKIDEWGLKGYEALEGPLYYSLQEIFSLPSIDSIQDPRESDLALEVFISNYQAGEVLDFNLGEIGLPIFWRPKVEVKSRLYVIKTKEVKSVITINEKLKWRDFISRMFTWRAILRLQPVFDKNDMQMLLYKACEKHLIKLRKEI